MKKTKALRFNGENNAKLGFSDLKLPQSLFNQLTSLRPLPSVIVFNQLFTAISKLKWLHPHSTIISLSRRLDLLGLPPDNYSLTILANSYCHLGFIDFGFSLLGKSLKLGYPPDCVTFTSLINGYILNDMLPQAAQLIGDNASALTLLTKMHSAAHCKPNLVIYNTIIDSLCKDSLLQQAMDLFSAIKTDGIQPNVVTYTSLIRGLYNSGCREEAKAVLTEMLKTNIAPTVVTYSTLVDMFCKDGNVKEAQATLQLMTHKGVTPNIFTYNALLDGYCLRGQMRDAKKLLDIMAQNGCEPDLAVALLEDMEDKGIRPDIVTYNILMDSLCEAGQLEDAAKFFSDLVLKGLQPSLKTYNILVKGFCKKGLMNEANDVLRKMEKDGCLSEDIFLVMTFPRHYTTAIL
uniref:Pentatricopeptide repeat-containing protein n=1 Tax=Chenopodium quinoa TaxID=63459 RepID=A0A803KN83_CHEQI